MRQYPMLSRWIKIILYTGAFFAFSYMTAISLKFALLLGVIYFFIVLTSFMAIGTGIGMAYFLMQQAGHPLPGFYSLMSKHLTPEQFGNLNKDYVGRREAVMHEFLITRMDIIFPSSIAFILLMTATLPSIAGNTLDWLVMAELFSIYLLSYLIYTVLNAYLYSIKIAGSMNPDAVNFEDIMAMTFAAAT